jgi:hypothetical protein
MGKKMGLAVLGLAGYLALALPAAHGDGVHKDTPGKKNGITKTVVVELKGQLRHHLEERYVGPEFALTVNGTTYGLGVDANPKLRKRAEQLDGQTVIVTGRLTDGKRFKHVAVTSLKADSSVKTTVQVEIKGKLVRGKWIRTDYIGHTRGNYPFEVYEWSIVAGKETYELDFSKGLPLLIALLKGKTVVVTGTLEGNRIVVTSLEPDASGAVQKTVNVVEVQGQLCQDQNGAWKVAVNGTLYTLDFGASKEFYRRAQMELQGKKVVVKGTLKDGVIRVTSLESAERIKPDDRPVPMPNLRIPDDWPEPMKNDRSTVRASSAPRGSNQTTGRSRG